ncbi:MAG: CocE/NonD family hydrolase [Actinomycetota bacterium]
MLDVQRIDHTWIATADGTRLAARIWRPMTDERVPAILEYLPYRKADATWPRDEPIASWFAEHGYAFVRVDIRGTGDSDGIITDEYAPQEQDDALDALAWIAAEPWCTGAVGMIGISWGGFNGLQIAARRPPALKAVVSLCSTDDRYADDVHYKGGCVLAWDAVPWAAVMSARNALPPHPWTVDEGWRAQWLDRLDRTPPFLTAWMTHQRRDDYWRHGSVCEDYGAIEVPVYLVGGWLDGYTNAIPRMLAGLPGVRKGLIGPWPHAWPHDAAQGPRIGFLQESARWFQRWLRDDPNGIEDEPMLRAWLQEPAGPEELALDRPGRWVSEPVWPPPARPARRYLAADGLAASPGPPGEHAHRGLQRHGLLAGTWCPYGPAADVAPDQREEDALCLTFETEPLAERVELLGHPRLHLAVAADRPRAFVVARLCAVAPDGTSTLLSRGVLNLTHRDGHDAPTPLEPGRTYEVDLELDALGQAIAEGHRLRLALSSTYWPWLWPSPEAATLTVTTGEGSWLELPARPTDAGDGPPPSFGEPESGTPLAVTRESQPAFHRIERDVVEGVFTMELNQDGDEVVRYPDGMVLAEENRDRFTIREHDPLSARVQSDREVALSKGDWSVHVRTRTAMHADATHFHLFDRVEAYEAGERVFERTWERSIPRDLV